MKRLLLVLVLGSILVAAGSAGADDEFEHGFQDELGRIAAHEAVYLGRGVLARILLGPPPAVAYYPPPPPGYVYGYGYPAYGYYGPPPGYAYPHHHHHSHHHHHHDCD